MDESFPSDPDEKDERQQVKTFLAESLFKVEAEYKHRSVWSDHVTFSQLWHKTAHLELLPASLESSVSGSVFMWRYVKPEIWIWYNRESSESTLWIGWYLITLHCTSRGTRSTTGDTCRLSTMDVCLSRSYFWKTLCGIQFLPRLLWFSRWAGEILSHTLLWLASSSGLVRLRPPLWAAFTVWRHLMKWTNENTQPRDHLCLYSFSQVYLNASGALGFRWGGSESVTGGKGCSTVHTCFIRSCLRGDCQFFIWWNVYILIKVCDRFWALHCLCHKEKKKIKSLFI